MNLEASGSHSLHLLSVSNLMTKTDSGSLLLFILGSVESTLKVQSEVVVKKGLAVLA